MEGGIGGIGLIGLIGGIGGREREKSENCVVLDENACIYAFFLLPLQGICGLIWVEIVNKLLQNTMLGIIINPKSGKRAFRMQRLYLWKLLKA